MNNITKVILGVVVVAAVAGGVYVYSSRSGGDGSKYAGQNQNPAGNNQGDGGGVGRDLACGGANISVVAQTMGGGSYYAASLPSGIEYLDPKGCSVQYMAGESAIAMTYFDPCAKQSCSDSERATFYRSSTIMGLEVAVKANGATNIQKQSLGVGTLGDYYVGTTADGTLIGAAALGNSHIASMYISGFSDMTSAAFKQKVQALVRAMLR